MSISTPRIRRIQQAQFTQRTQLMKLHFVQQYFEFHQHIGNMLYKIQQFREIFIILVVLDQNCCTKCNFAAGKGHFIEKLLHKIQLRRSRNYSLISGICLMSAKQSS